MFTQELGGKLKEQDWGLEADLLEVQRAELKHYDAIKQRIMQHLLLLG